MTKYAQLVMGSAGVGKSTFCRALQEHCSARGRNLRVWNLDPAAEGACGYSCSADAREAVSVDEVQAELGLGPNGALVAAMEMLVGSDWMAEAVREGGGCGAAVPRGLPASDAPGCARVCGTLPPPPLSFPLARCASPRPSGGLAAGRRLPGH
jgi:hypothetical protein